MIKEEVFTGLDIRQLLSHPHFLKTMEEKEKRSVGLFEECSALAFGEY